MSAGARGRAAILSALALAACATVGPDYVPPPLEAPDAFQAPPPIEGDEVALGAWWRAFDDPTLALLVARGTGGSLELQLAESRLREARAQLRQAQAARVPFIGFGTSGSARLEGDGGPSFAASASAALDASWEADLFGGTRRSVEAAAAGVDIAAEQRRAVLVALSAEVGIAYIELRGGQRRLAIARELLETQERTLGLVQERAEVGLATQLDVERSRSSVESLRAQIPGIESAIQDALNRLAVLLGEPPGALDAELAEDGPVPAVVAGPGIGLPAELLRRRPDLREAERALAQATAQIGIATANLYPRLTLPGALTVAVGGIGTGTIVDSVVASLAAALSLPLFDGGEREAAVDAASERAQQALLAYRQALLLALDDVERALVLYAETRERHAALQRAVAADTRAYDLAVQLYQEGVTSFLDLLDAQRSLTSSRQELEIAEAALSTRLVGLYRALGGGWEDERLALREAAARP